ncbi:MAG TPA: RNA polymerase sigma factor [Candidatus Dormibacteraeota bacterium]|jgi:RNA polymerase sigma-70 factor (ECF subfamily)|nr:RNA polymerase sigma factor [Candidatus Dormibacteraeota bacterium]
MQGRCEERAILDEFELQYQQYRLRIYRTILGIVLDTATAEDLTQETFERAYRWYRRHRDVGSMGAWLHRIAVNAAISYHRRQSLARLLPFRLFLGPPTSGFDAVEARSLARRALAALSPKLRATVILHFYLGMTRDEIARTLGIPPGTVASRLSTALQTMKKTLMEAEPERRSERLKGNASQRT